MSNQNQTNAVEVARYYQAQHADFDDDLPLYQQLAQSAGGPILELGCGTGRVLLPLASKGFVAVGVDHDLAMLTRCQSQLDPSRQPTIHLIQADIKQLPLRELFQLVLAPCSTMAYLDDRAFVGVLAQLRRLLAAGGRLAMDLPAPAGDLLSASEQEVLDHFHEPERGTDIQISAVESSPAPQVRQVEWHYDEMLPDGTIQRQTVSTRYHLRNLQQITDLIKEADFQFEAAYGDYQLNEYKEGSPGMIVVASG